MLDCINRLRGYLNDILFDGLFLPLFLRLIEFEDVDVLDWDDVVLLLRLRKGYEGDDELRKAGDAHDRPDDY